MSILKFNKTYNLKSYLTISILGKSYKLNIKYTSFNCITLNQKDLEFNLLLPKKYINKDNIEIINKSIKKLYTQIAPKEIEDSLELARYILKFAPEDYKIERIKNNYYKLLNKNVLIINPDIVQYNKEIINTTMIQEFCKMKYGEKTNEYKIALKTALNKYENYKLNSKYNSIQKFSNKKLKII